MRLTRDVTPEHLRALQAYLKRRPEGRRYRYLEYGVVVALMSIALFAFLVSQLGRDPLLFVVSPLIGAVLAHLVLRYQDERAQARFIASNSAELGHQEFWLDEEGFGNSTPAGSTFHKWPTISAVEETAGLIFVAGGALLYMIPTATLDDEASRFAEELRRRWQAQQAR